eukprot:TRINITY_DN1217_c0_g1_i1.p1 TRINITY_DN1217_c0_g1~~TRINITY_DN1217_c0_g1_i1.p1  ORF type:complete len:502 (+),score=121.30 TRINITY_DN1217_c0_g1_i1:95-1600(+)
MLRLAAAAGLAACSLASQADPSAVDRHTYSEQYIYDSAGAQKGSKAAEGGSARRHYSRGYKDDGYNYLGADYAGYAYDAGDYAYHSTKTQRQSYDEYAYGAQREPRATRATLEDYATGYDYDAAKDEARSRRGASSRHQSEDYKYGGQRIDHGRGADAYVYDTYSKKGGAVSERMDYDYSGGDYDYSSKKGSEKLTERMDYDYSTSYAYSRKKGSAKGTERMEYDYSGGDYDYSSKKGSEKLTERMDYDYSTSYAYSRKKGSAKGTERMEYDYSGGDYDYSGKKGSAKVSERSEYNADYDYSGKKDRAKASERMSGYDADYDADYDYSGKKSSDKVAERMSGYDYDADYSYSGKKSGAKVSERMSGYGGYYSSYSGAKHRAKISQRRGDSLSKMRKQRTRPDPLESEGTEEDALAQRLAQQLAARRRAAGDKGAASTGVTLVMLLTAVLAAGFVGVTLLRRNRVLPFGSESNYGTVPLSSADAEAAAPRCAGGTCGVRVAT